MACPALNLQFSVTYEIEKFHSQFHSELRLHRHFLQVFSESEAMVCHVSITPEGDGWKAKDWSKGVSLELRYCNPHSFLVVSCRRIIAMRLIVPFIHDQH